MSDLVVSQGQPNAIAVLTRRQTLWAMAGVATLGLVGCGGGGGHHGGASTDSANVAVQLPTGFSIAATDLQAGTAYGTGKISNGTFKARISSKGPTFAYLQQKSTGVTLMVGLVGHGRPGLSALSSAAFLVAMALGISGLPPTSLGQAMALLEINGDVQALAATISTTLPSDPLCLSNGNATVTAAIKTAVEAVGGGAAPALARSVSRADPAPLILVQPSSDQGGAEVNQSDDAGYVVPTNTKRRPISAYTYRVGHVAADGTTTPVSPAQRIDQQDIDSTNSIVGTIASLGAKGVFGPMPGKRVGLDVSSGDSRTQYETVVLMATGDNAAADPAFFTDAKYANEVAEWRTKLGDLNVYSFLGGILFDLFQSVLGGAVVALSVTRAQLVIAAVADAEASAQTAILASARAGVFGNATRDILKGLVPTDLGSATNLKFRKVILELLGRGEAAAETAAAGAEGSAITALAVSALAIVAATGSFFLAVDAGKSYFDALFSPKGELWTETALIPSVAISPSSAQIPAGANLGLTVGTPGVSETKYKFHWKLDAGGNGNIGDPDGTGGVGHDITTAGTVINLATAPSDVDGAIYTVTVAAIDLKTGETLGTARARITIKANTSTGEYPGKFRIFDNSGIITSPEFPDGLYNGEIFALVDFSPVADAQGYFVGGTGPTHAYGSTAATDGSGNYTVSGFCPPQGQLYYPLSGGMAYMANSCAVARAVNFGPDDHARFLAEIQLYSSWTFEYSPALPYKP